MDGASTSSLPVPLSPCNQDRRGGVGRIGDLFVERKHAAVRPTMPSGGGPVDGAASGIASCARRASARDTVCLHFGDVERLADVVEGACPDRLHGRVERPESTDQHNLAFGVGALERLEDVEDPSPDRSG